MKKLHGLPRVLSKNSILLYYSVSVALRATLAIKIQTQQQENLVISICDMDKLLSCALWSERSKPRNWPELALAAMLPGSAVLWRFWRATLQKNEISSHLAACRGIAAIAVKYPLPSLPSLPSNIQGIFAIIPNESSWSLISDECHIEKYCINIWVTCGDCTDSADGFLRNSTLYYSICYIIPTYSRLKRVLLNMTQYYLI